MDGRKVAEFSVHYYRCLSDKGQLLGPLPDFADQQTTLALYRNMVLIRTFDSKAIRLQRTGRLGTYASIYGHEALSTAIGHAMRPEDVLLPYYRDYAAQYLRGVRLSELFNYWGGDERGSDFQHQAEDFPISVPIASQCLHATGVAFAFQYRQEARVAVTTVGDGGTSEGEFYEAINLAGTWQLPVVFIVNNNQWAISVPASAQTHCQTFAQKAIAAGFEGIQVDGNDILACREAFGRCIEKARGGQGPQLVEAITYRLCDHTTADDASRYRDADELANATQQEPVARCRHWLYQQGWWDEKQEAAWQQECQHMVKQAVDDYLAQGDPPLAGLFEHHYATLPPCLEQQKQQCLAQEEPSHARS